MELHRTGSAWDRTERNKTNENWEIIEANTRKLESEISNVSENIKEEVVDHLIDSAKLDWKEPVSKYADLPSTPKTGETRMTRDTGKVFRYDGTKWVEIQDYDATAINEVDSRLTSQMAQKAPIPTTGNKRGSVATDFQFIRTSDDQVAGTQGSFIAGGANNKIQDIPERGTNARYGHAEGFGNSVHEWYGHVEGAGSIVDGKISHAEGNAVICSANDSHAEGNITVAGRKYYTGVTYGSEDAGDSLGTLNFVLIPASEGDVSSNFPNILTDNIEGRYGTGAKKDVKGNIYASNHVPAVWTGNVPTTKNDLQWALHSICIIRGTQEAEIIFVNIAKTKYTSGVGTKVYYYGPKPFNAIEAIYGSYAPTVSIDGVGGGGTGNHAEGNRTSTYGYGAHAEGFYTRAWNWYAHAEGHNTKAYGEASHAQGTNTEARGKNSHAEGNATKAMGSGAHAEGLLTIASGEYSRAYGRESEAIGDYSAAYGYHAKATRMYQESYSHGKIANVGDNQATRISYSASYDGVGWWVIPVLENLEEGKAYHISTMVIGRQRSGSAGKIGDTFAYKFEGLIVKSGGVISNLGTPVRTLVGRTPTMEGDGLTTGVRMSWGTSYSGNTANLAYLRLDGLLNTRFMVTTYSTIQEMGL